MSVKIQGRSDVRELHSQYPILLWIDADGEIRKHTCDYFVVFDDGLRLAVAVKYQKNKEQLEELIKQIRLAGFTRHDKKGHLTVGAVDDMVHLSEAEATIDDFENAQCIVASRHHNDPAEFSALLEIVRRLPGRFRFGELLRNCTNRANRRTAIWRLIDVGHLVTASTGRIDELAWLRFRG
ncbi:hypothetical protein [Rhizobium deserti]|uniref:hypothetical protein n=1 Tax=Rhizobium deserti TaxID=2547961 RepID=UPI001FDF4C7F|nr:hypothetical protein [Rhizobium deserti]